MDDNCVDLELCLLVLFRAMYTLISTYHVKKLLKMPLLGIEPAAARIVTISDGRTDALTD